MRGLKGFHLGLSRSTQRITTQPQRQAGGDGIIKRTTKPCQILAALLMPSRKSVNLRLPQTLPDPGFKKRQETPTILCPKPPRRPCTASQPHTRGRPCSAATQVQIGIDDEWRRPKHLCDLKLSPHLYYARRSFTLNAFGRHGFITNICVGTDRHAVFIIGIPMPKLRPFSPIL